MKYKRQINWNWLAGFFEGDGCVSCFRDKKNNKVYTALRVDITQKNIHLIKRLKRFLARYNISGSILPQKNRIGCYHLIIATRQAERFIQNIYPFFVDYKKINQVKRVFKKINKNIRIVQKRNRKYIYNETNGEPKK